MVASIADIAAVVLDKVSLSLVAMSFSLFVQTAASREQDSGYYSFLFTVVSTARKNGTRLSHEIVVSEMNGEKWWSCII